MIAGRVDGVREGPVQRPDDHRDARPVGGVEIGARIGPRRIVDHVRFAVEPRDFLQEGAVGMHLGIQTQQQHPDHPGVVEVLAVLFDATLERLQKLDHRRRREGKVDDHLVD